MLDAVQSGAGVFQRHCAMVGDCPVRSLETMPPAYFVREAPRQTIHLHKPVLISVLDRSDRRLQTVLHWIKEIIQKQGRLNKEKVYLLGSTDGASLAKQSIQLQRVEDLRADDVRHLHLVVKKNKSKADKAFVSELNSRSTYLGKTNVSIPRDVQVIPASIKADELRDKLASILRDFAQKRD